MDIPLRKQITVQANGKTETVKKLKVRDPSFADCEIGWPYSNEVLLDPKTGRPVSMIQRMDAPLVSRWLVALSGHTDGILGQLHASDVRRFSDWLFNELNDDSGMPAADAEKNSAAPSVS